MNIAQFQELIEQTYGAKDRKRGIESTWLWFSEEVGELARAINGRTSRENLRHEFADVLAWLTTLANIAGVDLDQAVRTKYVAGCPGCRQAPCECDQGEKP